MKYFIKEAEYKRKGTAVIGAGVGAAAGAKAGATVGSRFGLAGGVAGAVIGGIGGGLAGARALGGKKKKPEEEEKTAAINKAFIKYLRKEAEEVMQRKRPRAGVIGDLGGAAVGGRIGATVGMLGGPIGMLAGGAIGAIGGAIVGGRILGGKKRKMKTVDDEEKPSYEKYINSVDPSYKKFTNSQKTASYVLSEREKAEARKNVDKGITAGKGIYRTEEEGARNAAYNRYFREYKAQQNTLKK